MLTDKYVKGVDPYMPEDEEAVNSVSVLSVRDEEFWKEVAERAGSVAQPDILIIDKVTGEVTMKYVSKDLSTEARVLFNKMLEDNREVWREAIEKGQKLHEQLAEKIKQHQNNK